MNIKTWAERAESLSDDTVVTSLHLAQFRQAEIDELRSENARLRAALEKAAMDIEAWGESSSKHRQDMWDLKADIDAARAALGEK